jgi:predicted metalloprotease with PDZ domain
LYELTLKKILYMRCPITLMLLLVCGICSSMDEYLVRVPDVRERLVHVEASVLLSEEGLLMSPFGADHLEFGWATFVRDLSASTTDGKPLKIERHAGGSFTVDHAPGGMIDLRYTVHIGHDLRTWPFGAKEAAYVQGEMMMATGNALFITRLDLDSARVRFELPEGQGVLTAWNTDGDDHYAKGAEELVWTVMLMGRFDQLRFKAGDMQVVIAYSEELKKHTDLFRAMTLNALDGFAEYYGGPPVATASTSDIYLQVINVDSTYEGGGAVFTNSISIMLNKPPARCDTMASTCWHHIMVHEIGHLWNALTLVTDEQDQWFREGFNDHLAWLLQHELGFFTREQWQQLIRAKEKEAQEAARSSKTSLLLAGNDKGANYDLIYSGGFTFAQRLDNAIVHATTGGRNLLSVHQLLYERLAGKNVPVDREVLRRTAEEVCECDLAELFAELEVVH